MKTTQQLIELQRSITQGEWATAYTGDSTYIYAETNERIATVSIRDSHEQMNNATAIALVPELLAEVIRLREALGAIANKLEAQDLGYMPKELWPNTRSEMILSARALLADAK